jgi:hypothetical protein
MVGTRGIVGIGAVAALAAAAAFGLMTATTKETPGSKGPAAELAQPTRHFRVPNPARLSDTDAMSIYDRIRNDMVAAYRLSQAPVAARYDAWRRYNRAPYLSATHGDRYINNYANAEAESYGQKGAAPMPAGAVLAKDSFTVTAQGNVFTGPLFLMEKMAPGFAPEARNWRYRMIMPDGSLFGTTHGEGSERVAFCARCHRTAGDAADHLFFVPEAYRTPFLLDHE